MSTPGPTLKGFLEGTALTYQGGDRKRWTAVFKKDDGITLKQGRATEKADVPDELGATRFYHNVMRDKNG